MDTLATPPGLAGTLRAAGYGVRGPAGVGSGGPVWTAVGPLDGEGREGRVTVHTVVLPAGGAGDRLVRRLHVLQGLDHPHLAPLVDLLELDRRAPGCAGDRRVAVLVGEVPGATLAAVRAARGPFSAGEVVALTVPLAGALDTLHRAGLAHGDVSPANIVVRPDGHPVLIDLLGTLDRPAGRGAARGTPGFAAPEVAAGSSGPWGPRWGDDGGDPAAHPSATTGPPGAPADVFGLATVALTVLDPACLGGPLGQELTAARAADPVLRPTAGELAAGCFARAAPAPIALPDAGALARTALAQLAGEDRTVSLARRPRHRAPVPRPAPVRRGVAAAALVASALLVASDVAPPPPTDAEGAVARATERRSEDRAVRGAGPTDPTDPAGAAVALTRRRAEVLASGQAAAVAEVARPGSSAADADLAVLRALGAAGTRLSGLTATDVSARVVPVPVPAPVPVPVPVGTGGPAASGNSRPGERVLGERVEVSVTAGVSGHLRVTGGVAVEVPAQAPRTVVLTLVWTADGWRVEAVREP